MKEDFERKLVSNGGNPYIGEKVLFEITAKAEGDVITISTKIDPIINVVPGLENWLYKAMIKTANLIYKHIEKVAKMMAMRELDV